MHAVHSDGAAASARDARSATAVFEPVAGKCLCAVYLYSILLIETVDARFATVIIGEHLLLF